MIGSNEGGGISRRRPYVMIGTKPSTVTKVALDLVVWLIATPIAFLIRYDGSIPVEAVPSIFTATVGLVLVKLAVAIGWGLYRKSWVKLAFRDLGSLAIGAFGIASVVTLLLVWFGPQISVPRSIGIIDGVITFLMMGGVRASARYLDESRLSSSVAGGTKKRVLVIGAGEGGSLVVREMLRHPETGLVPVGFIDDDLDKVGHSIATVPVRGTLDDLEDVIVRYDVDEVLIAMPSAAGTEIRNVVERIVASHTGVTYRTIPGVYELLSGKVSINRIREVDIEDLLRRPPVELDISSIRDYIEGKRVMVTGAGGSIGSELVRQICRFRPKELILFGHGENSIYTLERELERDWPNVKYHSVIGAIQNGPRMDYVFRHYGPQVIFHTAAHKHVPLMELNPEEAIFNNVVGSKTIIDLSLKYGISHFVNISTDKAVNPTSIMGASKWVVEHLVHAASRHAREDQMFVSVRFGNVLGSRGSVIPLFKEQIRRGGPVTVTHPDMVRYFMTIPEAAQLVLQASGLGKNGEIYILDMGEPVKIMDLARDLIELSGFKPNSDIHIELTGIRPGEKLYEETMTEKERVSSTSHEKISVAKYSNFSERKLNEAVASLQKAALESDYDRIRQELDKFLGGSQLKDTGERPAFRQTSAG